MIKLYDMMDGTVVSRVTPHQLEMLQAQLDDTITGELDHCVDESTIDFLKSAGADRSLVKALERAMSDRVSIQIGWEELQ